MLYIKFQTSEHSGLNTILNFFMYFYGLSLGPPCARPSWTQGPLFEQISKGPLGMLCYIPNFKHLSKVVLKKKIFEYFSMYFHGANLGPL